MRRRPAIVLAVLCSGCAAGAIASAIDNLRLSACFGDCNAALLLCGDESGDACFASCQPLDGDQQDACETACTRAVFACFEVWGGCGEACLAAAEESLK
ncbi:MAG: hypothetical protein CL484_00340 [Acidobacteria bacterium]|nr:hypothetical protein [Acidobacteriota bacterium]|tara:strand:- start:1034 stop:1330 length:297 start_codon:yes stop_codon:yes gene_type:complete